MELLLLPSPFLGSEVYAPLAAAVERHGAEAVVAPAGDSPDASALVTDWTSRVADRGDVVLVPHSNAGYLAPAVAAATGAAVVFMDAALPERSGHLPLAPTRLRALLAGLADAEGRLPRWTRWWPHDELAEVLPEPWFSEVDACVPQVRLAYVDGGVEVPEGWQRGRRAYLAFGATTYGAELATAARLGWPRQVLNGGHLHCVVEPERTAAALVDLAGRITARAAGP